MWAKGISSLVPENYNDKNRINYVPKEIVRIIVAEARSQILLNTPKK